MKKEQFDSLTPDQKRVLIMRDVIKQVLAKKYIATRGTYITEVHLENNKFFDKNHGVSKSIVERITSCHVCAIGSAVMSALKLFAHDDNELSLYKYDAPTEKEYFTARLGLRKWFEWQQIDLIESYFETSPEANIKTYYREYNRITFANKYPLADQRLVAIAKNIIRNKGKFVPPNYKKQRISLVKNNFQKSGGMAPAI